MCKLKVRMTSLRLTPGLRWDKYTEYNSKPLESLIDNKKNHCVHITYKRFYMHNIRKALCLSLTVFAAGLTAESRFAGVVIDSITRTPIEAVLVQQKGSTRQAYTDSDGQFTIVSSTSSTQSHPTSGRYGLRFIPLSRTITWDASFPASFTVHNALGRAMSRQIIDARVGSYAIPRFNNGHYILTLTICGRAYTTKMMVMDEQVMIPTPLDLNYAPAAFARASMSPAAADTLVFTKPGFVDKKIAVTDGDMDIVVTLISAGSSYIENDTLVDLRDGQKYAIVTIGAQTWMAQNLNIGEYRTSIRITGQPPHSDVSNNGTIEKYAYNNDTTNLAVYGGLYDWDEAMGYSATAGARGICPAGWHIPTDAEWKTLEMSLGMTQAQANSTFQRGTDQGTQLTGGGSSGFKARLSGYRYWNGTFREQGQLAGFWSSTPSGSSDAWFRTVGSSFSGINRNYSDRTDGFCIRCLKD